MVTREGRVEVVRVCEVGTEGGGEGETHMSLIRSKIMFFSVYVNLVTK